MKSRLYASLSVVLSLLLSFGAPVRALAETFPNKLDKWVCYRSIEDGWWKNIKKSVVKFAQYDDFFSPTLTNGAKLYVKESEKDGVATLTEANCTLKIEKGAIAWVFDSYHAVCDGKEIGLLKASGITFGSIPKVVVKGSPELVKPNPGVDTTNPKPRTGTGSTNPQVGTGDTNPQIGTGDTNPQVGTGDTNPQVGTGDTNPTTVKKTPFDEALEKLSALFPGKKVPPAVIEFLAAKDESSKSAFVEWMKKTDTTADSLLKQYKLLDEVVNALMGKNAAMVTWLADKKQVSEKDLLQFLCPETEKTSVVRTEVRAPTVKDQAGNIATGNGNFDDNTNTVVTAPNGPSYPKEILDKCDALKKQQALDDARNTPSGNPNTLPTNEVPDPNANAGRKGNLTISPDKEEDKPDDSKKKADMARCALGGAYGAVAFGILGMIFGGPFGMVLGAAMGFGLLAGMTYLNNNKIK